MHIDLKGKQTYFYGSVATLFPFLPSLKIQLFLLISMHNGLIHLYLGKGKGKTTVAVGLLVREVGAGLSVETIQFMKISESSDLNTLRSLPNVSIITFGQKWMKVCVQNHQKVNAVMFSFLTR